MFPVKTKLHSASTMIRSRSSQSSKKTANQSSRFLVRSMALSPQKKNSRTTTSHSSSNGAKRNGNPASNQSATPASFCTVSATTERSYPPGKDLLNIKSRKVRQVDLIRPSEQRPTPTPQSTNSTKSPTANGTLSTSTPSPTR